MPQIDRSTSDGFQNNENTASANFNKFVNNTEKVKRRPLQRIRKQTAKLTNSTNSETPALYITL